MKLYTTTAFAALCSAAFALSVTGAEAIPVTYHVHADTKYDNSGPTPDATGTFDALFTYDLGAIGTGYALDPDFNFTSFSVSTTGGYFDGLSFDQSSATSYLFRKDARFSGSHTTNISFSYNDYPFSGDHFTLELGFASLFTDPTVLAGIETTQLLRGYGYGTYGTPHSTRRPSRSPRSQARCRCPRAGR